jgi:hypothetical protein
MPDDPPPPPRYATVNWNGTILRGHAGYPTTGGWILISDTEHPRFGIGHEFMAHDSEITWD